MTEPHTEWAQRMHELINIAEHLDAYPDVTYVIRATDETGDHHAPVTLERPS